MYQVILFDVDNTLLKTDVAVWETVKKVFGRLEIPVSEKQTRRLMGLSAVEIFEKLGAPNPKQTVQDYGEEFLKHQDLVSVFPGVNELFKTLQAKGISIGIVTSKTKYGWQVSVKF